MDNKQVILEAKKISMMELRNSPGEIIDRVADGGEAFIIERKGEYLACLVPVHLFYPNVKRETITDEMENLHKNNEFPKIRLSETNELEFKFNETIHDANFSVKVIMPHGYPKAAPKVYVLPIVVNAPHTWSDGALALYGYYKNWEIGKDNILSTLKLIRKWLYSYKYWKDTGTWND